MKGNYEDFKKEIFALLSIDLNAYKEKQMKRRIETLIARKKFEGYEDYAEHLKSDSGELAFFKDYITINVTEFFRTDEHWKYLSDSVIPGLIKNSDSKLRIWSAGCSTGQEAYSLAMLMLEHLSADKFHIIATDVDEKVLEKARTGIYSAQEIESVPEDYRIQYFTHCDSGFEISEALKKCIEFRQHNILSDVYPEGVDLIVCRNILIYFTEEAKQVIYTRFGKCLKKGGCLFLGHTEQIVYYKVFGFEKKQRNFYVNGNPLIQ